MTISKRLFVLSLAAAASAGLSSSILAQTPVAAKRIGFLYIGAIGQYGWTFQHNQARLAVDSILSGRVQTSFNENVKVEEAEAVVDKLVDEGHSLIFFTSPYFKAAAIKAAGKHPTVKFELLDGERALENMTVFNNRSYEVRYVLGQIAAMTSKSNVIGYVAAFPLPDFVSGINAFTLGVLSVNPKAKVKVVWTDAWVDDQKERAAVRELAKLKVEVVGHHTYSTSVILEAEQLGLKSFGQTSDMAQFAPKATLTSVLDYWTPYYVDRIQRFLDGAWQPGSIWGGVDADMVRIAALTNAPEPVVAKAKKTIEDLRKGFNPFKGPITRADGKVGAAAGSAITEKEIRNMDWFVRGVDGKLPPAQKVGEARTEAPKR
jgi:basic membrane protein A and related proteins